VTDYVATLKLATLLSSVAAARERPLLRLQLGRFETLATLCNDWPIHHFGGNSGALP
jgi:hypothetical protein